MSEIQRYIDWLSSEIQCRETYHAHKETMAWVATALYVPGIIGLAYMASDIWRGSWGDVGTTLLVLVVACLLALFLNMQFRMRWQAADERAALRRVAARLCGGAVLPPPVEREICKSHSWPQFIQQEIDQSATPRNCRLAFGALGHMFLFRLGRVDARWQSELPSYVAIVIATVVAIALVWAIETN